MRLLLIAYGICNAILYASLLPLWEGFDEPFHYGYVQEFSHGRGLPVLGKTPLPGEIDASLPLAPASHIVQQNLPMVMTFAQYFQLSSEERKSLRSRLERANRDAAPAGLNYEVHQAPLAYWIPSIPDRMWASVALPERVWRLRLICGIAAVVFTAWAVLLLANRLGLPSLVQSLCLFVLFSSQMFYATVAHVANDWLAVILMPWLFVCLIRLHGSPSLKTALVAAGVLSAGLLTKAYFLAVAPVAAFVVVRTAWQRRLGWGSVSAFVALLAATCLPWYARNWMLYHNLTGMQEMKGGISWRELVHAVLHIPWLNSAWEVILGTLWTGNNHFSTFSVFTLTLIAAGYLVGAAAFVMDLVRHRTDDNEHLLFSGSLLYGFALMLSAALSFSFTQGFATTPSPWYAVPIVPLGITLTFGALSRRGLAGRLVMAWITGLTAYVMALTYWAKLIPMYGGYLESQSKLSQLAPWYMTHWRDILDMLSTAALGNPFCIVLLSTVVSIAAVALAVFFLGRILR